MNTFSIMFLYILEHTLTLQCCVINIVVDFLKKVHDQVYFDYFLLEKISNFI